MEAFDDHAAQYETAVERAISFAGQPHDVYLAEKARKLLELARRRLGCNPRAVLDVGCGPALLDRHLVNAVKCLHGVDSSAAMIERAQRTNPDAEYAVADARMLPYGEARFDLVFAACLLHHVARPRDRIDILGEMARVTKARGLVVVIEHNPLNPLTQKVVRSCVFDENVRLLGRREAAALLAHAGLEQTDSDYILFLPWRAPLSEALERRLARIPFGAQYVVAGRKRP